MLSRYHMLAASTIVTGDLRRSRHVQESPRLRLDLIFRMDNRHRRDQDII